MFFRGIAFAAAGLYYASQLYRVPFTGLDGHETLKMVCIFLIGGFAVLGVLSLFDKVIDSGS